MRLLNSKLAIVICGALFVGILSGGLAALSAMPPAITAAPVPTNGQAPAATSSPSAGGTATTTGTPTSQPTTSNSTPQPTPTPRIIPTPTTPPIGATLSLHGRVVSVDQTNNLFVLRYYYGTVTITCNVSSSTKWTGAATSWNMLQRDMIADVQGTYQGNGTLMTSSVNSQIDN